MQLHWERELVFQGAPLHGSKRVTRAVVVTVSVLLAWSSLYACKDFTREETWASLEMRSEILVLYSGWLRRADHVSRMGNIKFCHRHSRACGPLGTNIGRFCHFSDLTVRMNRRRHVNTRTGDRTLQNHRRAVSCVVTWLTHVAKCWRDFTFLATLYGIKMKG